ncbi:MAG: DNA starvation/stationary phase protection protein [Xanthomonadaceae bacterium]|nr:DNA starvation/stationary phase protection protein [Xanthomonadaceae bacterium]
MAKSKSSTKSSTKRSEKPSKASATTAAIDIGISGGDRAEIADGLSHVLADAYTLYLKTHNFHWNVTGPMFNALHTMFETQYSEQWTALDEIAERIRALGFNAPGSYTEFAQLSSIKETPGQTGTLAWHDMVQQLVSGNEAFCRTARKVLKAADSAGDDPSVDLLTTRLQTHEKYAWMLRSLLE